MWKQFRLMGPADAGGGAGAGGAGAAGSGGAGDGAGAGAGDAGAAQGGADASGAAAAASSALASGAAAPSGAPTGLEFLAEKFHVKTADGKLDEAASLRKQAEAYAPLVKRLGTDELPPATATDYKIKMPEGLEQPAFDEFLKDPATVTALGEMHKIGLTNSQADKVMSMYLASAQQIALGAQQLSADQTITELRKTWTTDADLTKNLGAAHQAAIALGSRVGVDFAAIEAAGLANNPLFIRIAAALAPELGEDRAPVGGVLPATDLDSLVKSKAYMDPKDPNHAAVKAKVDAHFAAQPGAGGKPRGPVTVTM